MTDDAAELRRYTADHCWQYDIRVRNLERDLAEAGMTIEQSAALRVADFEFRPLERHEHADAAEFIRRHEWLGNLSQYTTHWFGAFYNERLAGVLLFNMPNAFSKLLGEDTPQLERLLSRGACISWSPKNLASAFVSWACEWMAKHTQYRLFTAYSDPSAKELGTIYQACNWYYLGSNAGAQRRYISPHTGKVVSDRYFRQRTAYRRFARELGIAWSPTWVTNTGMAWANVPPEIEVALRQRSRDVQASAERIEVPSKHKYALVLGADRSETRRLRRLFEERNRTFPYPKVR